MKLFLSSYRIPVPDDLATLIGKPLNTVTVGFIPNAMDYYSQRARDYKVGDMVQYLERLGLTLKMVDLREYANVSVLKKRLAGCDLIWAMGGNTYVLRQEMRRSGFEKIINELLADGVVYGGDSAGALVAGLSIAGVEPADEPEFAEELIKEGLQLVPFVILPHVDNPAFAEVLPIFRDAHADKERIELTNSQAVIFDGNKHWVVEGAAKGDEAAGATHQRESQAQLAARLDDAAQHVTVGARYEHYKQLTYTVLSLGLREEDNEPCVVYRAEYGEHIVFIRPVSSWIEEVEVGGKQVKRFTKVDS